MHLFLLWLRRGSAGAACAAFFGLAACSQAATFLVTNTADSGSGSLRRAVNDAQANPGPDSIQINVTGVVSLTRSIDFTDVDPVSISGQTANTFILDGMGVDRVITVGSGSVLINGVTIRNGRCDIGAQGGGVNLFGGALELVDCAIIGNSVPGVVGDERNGGGVRSESNTIFIARRCLFTGNIAEIGLGGAIRATGNMILENCTFSGNNATEAGAISFRSDGAPVGVVDSCTVTSNIAAVRGGGIRVGEGILSIRNTIVAGNAAPFAPDVDEVFASLGFNLIGIPVGSSGWVVSDKLGLNPNLGPLMDNGGPTATHALLPGSPAIDAGGPVFPPTDQRGVPRPAGPMPDIGAFEAAFDPNGAPTANAGPDQSLTYSGSPVAVTLDGSGSTDPDNDTLSYTWYDAANNVVAQTANPTLNLGLGTHVFRLVVEDPGGLSDDDDVTINITAENQPPVANAGADQSFPYTGSNVDVTLDGSGSSDPEGGTLQYAWYDQNGDLVGSTAVVNLNLGPGTHVFRLVVEDESGQTDDDEVTILVQDPNAPTISGASATPTVLWPPNHKMRTITVSYSVSDDYDTSVTTWLTVTSSEADSGLGDGDVPNDIQIVNANKVRLRAERFAKAGRTYTITIHAMDDSGNESTKTLVVKVPHSKGKG